MEGVRGSNTALKDAIKRIRHLTSPEFQHGMFLAMAETSVNLAMQGFRDARDPFDNPWKKLKAKPGSRRAGGQILRDKGILMNSMRPIVNPNGFTIRGAVYGQYHQYGTSRIPQRMIFPKRS